METTRQEKIAVALQKELGEIFLLYAREHHRGKLISVTSVRVTPDLSQARVFLSIFPSNQGGALLAEINTVQKAIRFQLGQRMRHQLRIIPELIYQLDDSLDYLDKIDALLKQ
ncbi:MAG: 30S ribosome-binding factor RbfA [Prevotellaceae bacterium]|jgi:ribosome-binding factor A|nr:30S ribosome-binding factor RbfA [Prevotellaceae bacterium]